MGRENDFFVKWNGSFAKVINQKQKLWKKQYLLDYLKMITSLLNQQQKRKDYQSQVG